MVESPQVTRLEASADVPLGSRAVWAAILDGSRWPDWMASGDASGNWAGGAPRLTLDHVSPFFRPSGGREGATCAVGDIRQESAVVSRPFGLGARRVEWHSIVTDIDDGRSIEIASPAVGGLREWRLRVNILPTGVQPLPSWFRLAPPVERGDGIRRNERDQIESTRVRAILTYRPVSVFSRLFDRVSLRSMVQARLEAWIAGLARSLSILSDLESRAISEPIRYMPDLGRPATNYATAGSANQRPASRTTGRYPVVRSAAASMRHAEGTETATFPTVLAADDHRERGFREALSAPVHYDGFDDIVAEHPAASHTTSSVPAGEARLFANDGGTQTPDLSARPVPARAVPDVMPTPVVVTPGALVALAEAHGTSPATTRSDAGGPTDRGAPKATEVFSGDAPATEAQTTADQAPPDTSVPALTSVSLLDITVQALEESASTHLALPARDPARSASSLSTSPSPSGRGETDQSTSGPVRDDAAAPLSNPAGGVKAPAPRPMLFGEARPSTISASAIAASRRLAAMAANRPVTGLGGAATRSAPAVSQGAGAPTSEPIATDMPSAPPATVPTIAAVVGASRAAAAARVDTLPAAARAAFVSSVLPPNTSSGTPATPPTQSARTDVPSPSSDAAA
mgnify:CR=1 FL=1